MGRTVREHRQKLLAEHPEVQEEYDRLGPRFEVISKLIGARDSAKLTQAQLAKKMGVSQSVVARLESGEHSPRLDTLLRAAKAMGYELHVSFKRPRRSRVARPATEAAARKAPTRRPA